MTSETTTAGPDVLREVENLAELADRVTDRIRSLSQGVCEPDSDIASFALLAADVIHQDSESGICMDADGWHRAICAIAKTGEALGTSPGDESADIGSADRAMTYGQSVHNQERGRPRRKADR